MTDDNTNGELQPVVRDDGSFRFYTPLYAFEKANAPEGQDRRIGGIISTETRDLQNEVVLQRGLDFSPFIKRGFFNVDHAKGPGGVIGEPDPSALKFFTKGQRLPNGMTAPSNCHWAEGFLLHEPEADKIWHKARALEKSPTGRRFGFSIEGQVLERLTRDPKTIARAEVRHVALTHQPVNTESRLDIIAKAMSMGQPGSPDAGAPPTGARTGEGAGRVLAVQSLEHDVKHPLGDSKKKKKQLSKAEAVAHLLAIRPSMTTATAGRIVDLTLALAARAA